MYFTYMCVFTAHVLNVFVVGKFLRECLREVCTYLTKNESVLNDLDRASGDGDCGTTLKNGATCVL